MASTISRTLEERLYRDLYRMLDDEMYPDALIKKVNFEMSFENR